MCRRLRATPQSWTATATCVLALLGASLCRAQECQPYWKGLSIPGYSVGAIAVADIGTGSRLYGYGHWSVPGFPEPVRAWTGSNWESLGPGASGEGISLRVLDDGSGESLYFASIGPGQFRSMKRWRGLGWEELPPGMFVSSYPEFGPSTAPGFSTNALGIAGLYGADYESTFGRRWVVKWTGQQWDRIGEAEDGSIGGHYPMFAFDFGEGPELIVTGNFRDIRGVREPPGERARGMARWNGQRWKAIPPPPSTPWPSTFWPNAMCAWDDGIHGLSLYIVFGPIGSGPTGVVTQGIARWNGAAWESVGGGLSFSTPGFVCSGWALSVFDDGTGPALFVAGAFDLAGGAPARNIAKWNGQQWSPLGAGIGGSSWQMAVLNDGRGESLFVKHLTSAGGGTVWGTAQYVGCKGGQCYADCDLSHTLNANDFVCFLTKYVANDPHANCDVSTVAPAINAADFACFLTKYAAGCP